MPKQKVLRNSIQQTVLTRQDGIFHFSDDQLLQLSLNDFVDAVRNLSLKLVHLLVTARLQSHH